MNLYIKIIPANNPFEKLESNSVDYILFECSYQQPIFASIQMKYNDFHSNFNILVQMFVKFLIPLSGYRLIKMPNNFVQNYGSTVFIRKRLSHLYSMCPKHLIEYKLVTKTLNGMPTVSFAALYFSF